jgi:hypothetical protein
MAGLKDELEKLILGFVAGTPNPTLALLITACRFCFNEVEVKAAVDDLVEHGRLVAEGQLAAVGSEVLVVVHLRKP